MIIPGWTDVSNSFEQVTDDTLTHSTRDGSNGYVVGGDFASSEISQTVTIPDGYQVGARAVLTFQRGNIGDNTDDLGQVVLEALNASDVVVGSTSSADEALSVADQWEPRRLVLDIPTGATKLRTRLIATRDGGTGVLSTAFDDFDLRVHKLLDPSYVLEYDFTVPPEQVTPETWQRMHLAWPDLALPECMIAQGALAIRAPRPVTGESIAWSDSVGNAAAPFLGQFGSLLSEIGSAYDSRVYRESFRFVYQGPHLQLTGVGTKRRGEFVASASWSVVLVLKVREYGSGAGVCGIRDASGFGWGVSITSGGNVRATLKGEDGTKTATSAASIADGAPHQVAVVYDASGQTLKLYVDQLAVVSTSTSSGLGEFALPTTPAGSYPLRIGTEAAATDVFGGELLSFASWPSTALSQAEVQAMWTYGVFEDLTPSISQPIWVPSEASDELDADVTLVRCATTQVPLGYQDGYGLAIGQASYNYLASNDTSSTSAWAAESTVTATRSILDNTGLLKGIRIAGDASHGLVLPNIALDTFAATVTVVVFARALSGTPTLNLELLDASDGASDTDSMLLSTRWKRFALTGLSWVGGTSTAKLRLRCASTFEIAHVAFVGIESNGRIPTVIQDASTTLSRVYASIATTHPVQLNHEGELDVEGIALLASQPTGLQIANVGNAGNDKNRRMLLVGSSNVPRALHYDSAPASVQALCTAIDWSQVWRLRARWCRAGIPSAAGNTFAGLVTTGSVDSEDQDARTAAWTADATASNQTIIGASAAGPLDCYVRRFAVRAREPRL